MSEAADCDNTALRPEAQLGLALRRAREERGLSLRALASKLHRAHSNLHDYEKANRLPPFDVVQAYEAVLELEPGTLTSLHRRVTDQADKDVQQSSRPDWRRSSDGDSPFVAGDSSGTARQRRTRLSLPVIAAVVLVSVGSMALIYVTSRDGEDGAPAFVTVYNLEPECQAPRTDNCRLGLARDAYTRYTRENVIGYVWHGDTLPVECFIPDGAQVQAEDRTMSTRWYRVTVPDDAPAAPHGARAWLTGIRVRSGTEPAVRECEA